jgi:protein-tyrosine phosphatase
VSDRHIALEGATNFRDFGGYATADGRQVKRRYLFRSGALGGLTDADHEVVRSFGIRLICDLRRGSEASHVPTRWCAEPEAERWHLPLFPESKAAQNYWAEIQSPADIRAKMIDTYRALVITPGILEKYRLLFERLARDESCPVLVHCSAGKDRTGIVCALILSVLGVERATVAEDFLLSSRYYDSDQAFARLSSQIVDFGTGKDWTREMLEPVFKVEPAYLETAFAIIDREHGSVAAFLTEAAGVAPGTLEQIRARLLD